jgi:hypothetical protein
MGFSFGWGLTTQCKLAVQSAARLPTKLNDQNPYTPAREGAAMQITTVSTGLARLRYVLNWAGVIAGLLFTPALMAVVVAPFGSGWQIAFCVGAFLLPCAVGRVLRFILAGR